MIQIGRVLSVKNGLAYMEVTRNGACGSACAGCTSGACESKPEYISIPNELDAKEGDTVELFVNDNFVLHSIYKVYGIPLVIFLACIALANVLLPSTLVNRDLYLFAFGAASFIISFLILKNVDKKASEDTHPKMTKILG
ncbi:MAG: SoxR reducing system RseC family protein [Peptoniphilus sp.]|nr:SoxR reducing system RseC family protein [Peptoniphilus sp.]MDD7363341.1 SoxR reducing system RseC family protein [Bacillota bacterium]MDY6044260.1 SoxR reducing system RseC family protein [Peptoniphilus sp.]